MQPYVIRQSRPVFITSTSQDMSSDADLLRSYPALRAEDLANAWAYVRSHREQISAQIHDHEAA